MQQKVNAFFDTHPESEVVYSVLGTLFIELDAANRFAGGTDAKPVTHTRNEVVAPVEETEEVVEQPTTTAVDETAKEAVDENVAAPVEETVKQTPAPAAKKVVKKVAPAKVPAAKKK